MVSVRQGCKGTAVRNHILFSSSFFLFHVEPILIYVYTRVWCVISELAREKMWSRIHLIPALQAEEDRDQVRRYLADQAREKELLGENVKVYHADRFVKPTFAVTPEKTK